MTTQRLNEYFADEAAEYLDQLDHLLSESGVPDGNRLLRLATGVRGSMQMAGAGAISSVASRLEGAAIELNEARTRWSDELRYVAQRTVSDIRALVSALEQWGPEEERTVRTSIDRWEMLTSVARADNVAGTDDRPVVSVDSLFFDDEGPHILETPATGPDRETAVPIESLLLRGDDALREALALRAAFDAAGRGDAIPERPLAELVDELFDLIALGLSTAPEE